MRKSKKYQRKTFNVISAIIEFFVELVLCPIKILQSFFNVIDEIRS